MTHPLGVAALNRIARDRFRRHCRPVPRLTMSEWAEKYRVVNGAKWSNQTAPYLAVWMDAISDRMTQEVTIVAPSQSGKSEVILNTFGYFVDQEPSPLIIVQPTVEVGESFSKERIEGMLRENPRLRRVVGDARSRSSDNTIKTKTYPGGPADIVGANAPSGLAMRSKRVALLDERDRHPRSAGTEGDVKAIVRARTRRFKARRKIVEVSSPTDQESSLIWPSYLEGTQEVVMLVCPACGCVQPPRFESLKWTLDDTGKVEPTSVAYECAGCAQRISATLQDEIKRRCVVQPTAVARVPHKRSFRLHGILAAFHNWVEIAQEFVTANGQKDAAMRADMLRAFFNTTLGELYEDKATETRKSVLLARAKRYDGGAGEDPLRFQVPRDAGILTAGVDLQHAHGEIIVRAWGVGQTSWLIERAILRGDTSQPEWWQQLEDYRTKRTWAHESGARVAIRSLCIDAGDGTHSKRVYEYCAPRMGQHVYAIKGSSNPSAPLIPNKPTKVKPGRLYVVGVNASMDMIYRRLGMDEPGPGFLHLNEYATEDYVTQLLSMRRKVDEKTRKRRWEATPGVRNEVPDCEVYAHDALLLGPVPVTMLAAEVEKVNAEGATAREAKPAPAADVPLPPRPSSRTNSFTGRARGGWLR